MRKTADFLLKTFYILLGLTIVAFLIAKFILPNQDISTYDDFKVLDAKWYYLNSDGTKTDIEIPAKLDVEEGEIVTFGCKLPKVEDNKFLTFRASKQDVRVFVNGDLRAQQLAKDCGFFTDNATSAFIYIPINSADSNKTLTIKTQSNSSYTGLLQTVYYGEMLDLFFHQSKSEAITVAFAITLLIISTGLIILCLDLKRKTKMPSSFIHLAFATFLLCFWLIAQSTLRQAIFPNITLFSVATFWALMLVPIPFAIYMYKIQEARYPTLYSISIIINILVFFFCNAMWLFTDVDFFELIHLTWFAVIYTGLTIIVTSLIDMKKRLAKNYTIVMFGFIGLTGASAFQMYIYNKKTTVFSGIIMSAGLAFLLATAGIKAVRDYLKFSNEQKKLKEEIKSKDNKIEKMSIQILHSLAQAIDAKDTYTNGHSLRVAQYSLLLAREINLSEEMQYIIYYTALLHDIGKIGIPDSILQKSARLTDDEYKTIKTHTTIGYEILEHIEEIPEIELGARWHHERYDGKGYPDGLDKENIPINARIIAVADSYDAMTSSRVYRSSLSDEKVRSEIVKGIGTQFDPKIANRMLDLIDGGQTKEIMQNFKAKQI